MTCFDIKKLIDLNNETIEEILQRGTFELNPTIKEILKDNQRLREMCTHDEVRGGYCIYCGKEMEEEKK